MEPEDILFHGVDVQNYSRATLYMQVHSGSLHKVWVEKTPFPNPTLASTAWIQHEEFLGSNVDNGSLTVGSYALELDVIVTKYLRVMARGAPVPASMVSVWLSVGGIS